MDRPWPDLLARLVEIGKFGPGDKPTPLLVVGFATDQAKNIDVWERVVGVPSSKLPRDTVASMVLQWQKEGGGLGRRVAGLVRSKVKGTATIAAIRPYVEGRVSSKAGELIAGGDAAWEEAAREYRPMMEMIGQSLSPGFTVEAVQRRKQIANVLPDARTRTEAARKTDRKKGGEK